MAPQALVDARLPSPAQVMDWAQGAFPQLFPGPSPDLFIGAFVARYYPQSGMYIGVADGNLYILGPASGGQLMFVGSLGDFTCRVSPDACGGPIVLTAKVNGTDRTVTNGVLVVAPGDKVDIASSQASTFNGAAEDAVAMRDVSTSPWRWTAQVTNRRPVAGRYTLAVGSGSGSGSAAASVVLQVSAGDERNGTYDVMATNGTRQTLDLDFDVKSYAMTDGANPAVTGRIDTTSEAGSWEFVAPRGVVLANARFRIASGTVVGSFPFSRLGSAPSPNASPRPFVASRTFVTAAAALDGIYNRLGISVAANTSDSTIGQIRIRGGGALMDVCQDNTIYTIDRCPGSSTVTYRIAAGSVPGRWTATHTIDGSSQGNFSVASVGGQNVYLSAYESATSPGTAMFRIAVPDTDFTVGAVHGADTLGFWSAARITSADVVVTSFAANGSNVVTSIAHRPLTGVSPGNIRVGTVGSSSYFLISGSRIGAMVGARASANAGYLQLTLLD